MSAPWSDTHAPAASTAATISVVAPSRQVVRLQSVQASLVAATSAAATLQILSGSTVKASIDAVLPSAGGVSLINVTGMDLRTNITSSGVHESMTIAFSSGVAGATQKVNAQGDFVPDGQTAYSIMGS